MQNRIKQIVAALILLAVSLAACPAQLMAQNVELAWDPSDSPDVAGYKIYYKADSSELPLDGIEALEGPSPIDVGDVTSFTLTELPEGSIYYFRATAYDSSGYESTLSNLAASAWIPAPLAPERGEAAGSPATLIWSEAPRELDLTFTLVYGTAPELRRGGTSVPGGANGNNLPSAPLATPLIAAGLCLAAALLRRMTSRFNRKRLLAFAVCAGLALSTASCGGGGGGGGSSPAASASLVDDTVVVSGLTDSYYTTTELTQGGTYYWQVIAVDGDGQEYESEVSSFVAG